MSHNNDGIIRRMNRRYNRRHRNQLDDPDAREIDNLIINDPVEEQNCGECIVCYIPLTLASTYGFQCGHFMFCRACAERLENDNRRCAYCREHIRSVIQLRMGAGVRINA